MYNSKRLVQYSLSQILLSAERKTVFQSQLFNSSNNQVFFAGLTNFNQLSGQNCQFRNYSNSGDVAKSRLNRALDRAKSKKSQSAVQQQSQDAITPVASVASSNQVSSVVNHPALIITRDIEWGTVLLGYEQCNKYVIYDQNSQVVGLLAEDYTGIGNAVGRQLLRTRRSFTATVFSPDGSQVIFRVRRPMYLINSTMYVEDGQGNTVGEIQQRFHLLKRNYDLYMDKRQFAQISGNFLAWEFELKDAQGGTIALIDRNFSGFGKEIFTDAGKYVIHFGTTPEEAAQEATRTVHQRSGNPNLPQVTPLAKYRSGVQIIPTTSGDQLVVSRQLSLTERQITLACAISVDFDYFSQHSNTSGWLTPPIIMPMPMPTPTPGAEGGDVGGAAGGGGGDVGGSSFTPPPPSGDFGQQGGNLEGDLGGDAFPGDDFQQGGGGSQWGDSQWGGGGDGGDDGDGGGWGQIGEVLQDVFGIGDDS